MPRILLISAKEGDSAGLEQDLLDGGFDVTMAPAGEETLTFIHETLDLDVVLVDLHSSEAEALLFIREAKEGRPDIRVFVVATQAGPVETDFIGLVKSFGADDAMFRPYMPEFLRWRIKDLIRGEVHFA